MKCPECGSDVREGDAFCGSCGAAVATGVTAPPPPPDEPTPAKPAKVKAEKPKKEGGELVVRLPDWMGEGWDAAVRLAGSALVIGLAIQIALGVVILVLIQLVGGFDVDWGGTFRAPFDMFIAFHGPVENLGLWLTSITWIAVAFWAVKRLGRMPEVEGNVWSFAWKAALVYAIPMTILAAVVEPQAFSLPATGVFGTFSGVPTNWDWAPTFFLAGGVAAAASAVLVARSRPGGVLSLLRIESIELPPMIPAAWQGALRTLMVGFPALLGLLLIGSIIEFLDVDPAFKDVLVFLLSLLLLAIVWAGIDAAFAFLILSMQFLGGNGLGAGTEPFWMWGGVVIAAAAFGMGGHRAAQRLGPDKPETAIGVGALVGPIVGVLLFFMSLAATGVGQPLGGLAFGLPLLWAAASAVGGGVWASQQGMLSSIRFESQSPKE